MGSWFRFPQLGLSSPNNMKVLIIFSILVISVVFVNALPQFSVKPCDPAECLTLFGKSPSINDCDECTQCDQCVDLPKLREILGPNDPDVVKNEKECELYCSKGASFCKSECITTFNRCESCF